jgi:hypothetical protein
MAWATPMSPDLATKVVNVRAHPQGLIQLHRFDVYIGRFHSGIPAHMQGNWGNPFQIGEDGNRQEVIDKYRVWLYERLMKDSELWERIHSLLGGKRLGCFCAPQACHGDVLAGVADQGIQFIKPKERAICVSV